MGRRRHRRRRRRLPYIGCVVRAASGCRKTVATGVTGLLTLRHTAHTAAVSQGARDVRQFGTTRQLMVGRTALFQWAFKMNDLCVLGLQAIRKNIIE